MKKSSFKFCWEDILLEMLPSRALFLPQTKEYQLENRRISRSLERLKNLKLLLNEVRTPSPFAFPLLVERLKNTLSNEPIEKRVEKLIKKYND